MPQINYNIHPVDPIGLDRISLEDSSVVEQFSINNLIKLQENKIELHIYSTDKVLLDSIYNYTATTNLQVSSKAASNGSSEVILDPVQDALKNSYSNGGIILAYNFTDDLYSDSGLPVEFYINEISPDRTELRLLTTKINNGSIVEYTSKVQNSLNAQDYYNDFKLNFKDNKLITGVNIKTQDFKEFKTVVVKLYEPLPPQYSVKDFLTIEQTISDSVAYEIQTLITADDLNVPKLKGPNFESNYESNLNNTPSEYFNYNELFGFGNTNSYRELKSNVSELSANLSIDYNTFSDFVHYSSIEERLKNFQKKLNLITVYQNSIDKFESGSNVEGGISGSREQYKVLVDKIIDNFDHYDRHLFYESGSTSWPKQNSVRPYLNATGSVTSSWYDDKIISASSYDSANVNQLYDTVPSYIADDSNNDPFRLFVHLIGEQFDNLWIYSKAVTDKYNADNRLDKGISRDLVKNVLANFGVKLYTNTRSTNDLFRIFTGELFNTGSENISTAISASNNSTPELQYTQEIYKRIYHNLPMLLKSKGTEKSLRTLVNCFGVPSLNSIQSGSNLVIRTGAANNSLNSVNVGTLTATTSSLGSIRIDDTGSYVQGNTLSKYVSINKRNNKYTHDHNNVEVGYSPTDVLNKKIIEHLNGL